MSTLVLLNHAGFERDFHGPSYGAAFEELGHAVTYIRHDQDLPDDIASYQMMFHFYHSISKEKVYDLRDRGVTTVLLLGDEPCEFNRTKEFTPIYDLVFNQTGGMDNIEAHRRLGANMYPLPHCADPKRYYPVAGGDPRHKGYEADVCFIGTLTKRADRDYLRAVRCMVEARGWSFKTWGPGTENDRWIGYEEARIIYANTKVVFNPSAVADQPNWSLSFPTLLGGPACRIFNTAACKTLQVAPRRSGWYFQPFVEGKEIVYYDHTSVDDIVDTICLSLHRCDEDRMRIAEAGYHRVLAEHTYKNRAAVVVQHVAHYRRTYERNA